MSLQNCRPIIPIVIFFPSLLNIACVQNILACPQDVITLKTECSENAKKEAEEEINILSILAAATLGGGGSGSGNAGGTEEDDDDGDTDEGGSGGNSTETPSFSPAEGTYAAGQIVSVTTGTSDSIICYSIDSPDPACDSTPTCTAGTEYTTAITIASSGTLNAIACRAGYSDSSIKSGLFTIEAPAPEISPAGGLFNAAQSVTLSTSSPGATICYTTNGDNPACDSTPTCTTGNTYTGTAISVSSSGTLKAISCRTGFGSSLTTQQQFTFDTVPPGSINSFSGNAVDAQVELSWANPADSDFVGTKILRKSSGYSSSPTDGLEVYNSNGTTTTDTGVNNYQTYYFTAFAYDAAGNYANAVQLSALPLASGALWAKTTSGASTHFRSVATDSSGSAVVLLGKLGANVSFGSGINLSMSTATQGIVKYNSSGVPQWAREWACSGITETQFASIAVDSSGNIFLSGYQNGNGTCTYGVSVTATGPFSGQNAVIVKFNSSGTAQWARTLSAGSNSSAFNSIAVHSSGNIYAAGYQTGTSTFTFGGGVSLTGPYTGSNALLVKYSSTGTATWARTVIAGGNSSSFQSLALNSDQQIILVGQIFGSGNFTFGHSGYPSVTLAGPFSGSNGVVVKYENGGSVQWAKSPSSGTSASNFRGVALDFLTNGLNKLFVAGSQSGTDLITYDSGVEVAGAYASGVNSLLLKYNYESTSLWGRSVTQGSNQSFLNSVAVNSSDHVFAVGTQTGMGTFAYGPGITIIGTTNDSAGILIKYDFDGNALSGRMAYGQISGFSSVATGSGYIFVTGTQEGSGNYIYGPGVSATGGSVDGFARNGVLIKYAY